MSDELVPIGQPAAPEDARLQTWEEQRPAPPPPLARPPLERPVAAIRRYKWLLLSIVVLATAGGLAATQFVKPTYEVHADLMINTQQAMQAQTGPIRPAMILEGDNWVQLFKSYNIVDSVVTKLALYLQPDNDADSSLFNGFSVQGKFFPGKYELDIDKVQKRWHLASQTSSSIEADGGATDSVGKAQGFIWKLPKSAFDGTGIQKVRFRVVTPQEAAVTLIGRVNASLPLGSNYFHVALDDHNPQLAERIVNTWINDYVDVAAGLKKRNLVEYAKTLERQLAYSDSQLTNAEATLQHFKVNTITLPTEGGPVAAGVTETRDPVMKDFFDRSIEYENLKHGREELEAIASSGALKDSVPYAALLNPLIAQGGPAALGIKNDFSQLDSLESRRTALAFYFKPEWPAIQQLDSNIQTLKTQTIPTALRQYLAELKEREVDDSGRIASASQELQQIPSRTIDEMRYSRAVDVAAGLNTNLKNRYAEATLAEESATADVSVWTPAVAPFDPTKNTGPRILALAVLAGLGAAIGLALMLDKLDTRFRYPEQATDELGLPIAGTVPRFPKGGVDQRSPEQMFQLVESFRSLRMSVAHALGGPVSLAVSSPSPSEGKSFISANLAMSFAEAGLRTVLVDGDTRRGTLHTMFGLSARPGLTDYLGERAGVADILRSTAYDGLSFISAGVRERRSPELLTSPLLLQLIELLRATHDVVIFDTPPLAAGIDGYSIAAATGSLLVVLRVGQTERRMAAAKLRLLERLPVNVLGAVLNGVHFKGEYEYYGYVGGYEPYDEAPGTEVAKVP